MTLDRANDTLRALGIGIAGGVVAYLLGLPAPWLAGALAATLLAITRQAHLYLPETFKKLAFVLLGMQTGLSVTPESLERVRAWPLSLLGLFVTVVLIIILCMRYFRSCGWSRESALFASLPGALSLVLLLAEQSKADMRQVIVSQSVRLVLLIIALPLLIRALSPVVPAHHVAQMSGAFSILITIILSVAVALLFERCHVPAGLILGPCLCGACLQLTGMVHGSPPATILIPANVIAGVMIGLRFEGITQRDLKHAILEGCVAFAIGLGLAAAGAALVSAFIGLPYALTLLAYAPGGLEAMTVLAFALDLDPAYVGAHQVARYVGLLLIMPCLTKLILSRPRKW